MTQRKLFWIFQSVCGKTPASLSLKSYKRNELKQMIIHLPHSSRFIPSEYLNQFVLGKERLKHDMNVVTDSFTDELFEFDSASNGSIRVVFPASRLLVDPERFADDSLEPMNEKGMGVLYTKTYRGIILRPELNEEERRDLLANYFYPHQRKVSKAVQVEIEESGASLLIDCHSFPSQSYI